MSNNKTKAVNNIFSGLFSQLITLALGIIIPRLVLVNLGSEMNGLLNTISQILVYVSLLEAGVGAASLQALYKPVAECDYESSNGILSATNYFYKRTGLLFLFVVVIVSGIIPFVIESEIPTFEIIIIFLLSGIPSVLNYLYQAKYKLLLEAEGKKYITINLGTIIHIGTSLSKIALLLLGFGAIALQIMYVVFGVAQMIFYGAYLKKNYNWINVKSKPDFKAISQSKNAFVHQISSMIFSNTDVLIITFFCGLKMVSVYSTYNMLIGMLGTLLSHLFGFYFILGQTFNTDRNRFLKLFDLYEVCTMAVSFSFFCIAGLFIIPFLKLYTAGVTDANYIDEKLPYLFISIYLLTSGKSPSNLVINFAQHFKQTQWRSILESIINIAVSLIAVNKFGIYGVLIGTIVALLYRSNDMIIYSNKKVLSRSPWVTYRRWAIDLATFFIVTVGGRALFSQIELDNYFKIFFAASIACITIIPLFLSISFLFDQKSAKLFFEVTKSILSKYFKKKVKLKEE